MHKVPWMKSDLVQKPISRFAPPSSPHASPPFPPPLRRQPCCTVKLFFRTGPEKPISPLRTSFVTPRPPPANPAAAAAVVPAPLPILSVNCKTLKYNLLHKRGVPVSDTPLLHNQLKISILHFTHGTMGMGNRLRTEGESEQVEIRPETFICASLAKEPKLS